MTIALVGPNYVICGNDGEGGFFEKALEVWGDNCNRNPNKARFGNKNACKRRGVASKTELPVDGAHDCTEPGIDEAADNDEETAENVLYGDGDTLALVGPFKAPVGYLIDDVVGATNAQLKGKKVAYKFESEWKIGTFRGKYRGKKDLYKGHSTVCFGRALSMYLNLNIDNYGSDKDWVILVKN